MLPGVRDTAQGCKPSVMVAASRTPLPVYHAVCLEAEKGWGFDVRSNGRVIVLNTFNPVADAMATLRERHKSTPSFRVLFFWGDDEKPFDNRIVE